LIRLFPGLGTSGYRKTSEADNAYNCIAWAAGRTNEFWWPYPDGYWPPGAPNEETVAAFLEAYKTAGYDPCPNADLERGFEKIAIYVDSQEVPKHAARQLPNGQWTSKLGRSIDIRHPDLASISGTAYGTPHVFMKRRLPYWRRILFHLSERLASILPRD